MRIANLRYLVGLLAMVLCLSGGPAWAAGRMIDRGPWEATAAVLMPSITAARLRARLKPRAARRTPLLYTDGAWQDLATLGGTSSNGYGVNDLGHVVGSVLTWPGTYTPFSGPPRAE